MSTMPIELYTDGSALKNPGPGGLAYIIRYWIDDGKDMPESKEIDGNQGFRITTNNRMEIMAGIYGLRAIMDNINAGVVPSTSQVNLFTDSEYFCKAITNKWIDKWQQNNWMTSSFRGSQPQPVKNKDLWEDFLDTQSKLNQMGIHLTLTHVAGHSGHEWNEKADKLAVAASTGLTHIPDTEYEKITGITK